MKEGPFQEWVIELATRCRWRTYHVPMPMRAIGGNRFVPEPRAAGLPDLIMLLADPPRLIFAELKGTHGTLSEKQREFLKAASLVAMEAYGSEGKRVVGSYSWRPGDEPQIEAILKTGVLS